MVQRPPESPMHDTEEVTIAPSRPRSSSELETWLDVLRSLVGKTVTVVNPESYQEAPVGHQIRAGFYRARPVALGRDYVLLAVEVVHQRSGEKEVVRQFVPVSRIKRVSIRKNERLLHL